MSSDALVARPGKAYPLGATYDGAAGTNFALYSEIAESVTLCLVGAQGDEISVPLTEVDGGIWHAYLPGIRPGQRYGYRVAGAFDTARGLRCDPSAFLLDPYAKAFDVGDLTDSPHTMTGVVIDPARFNWAGDTKPDRPYHETIVYEAHVKGMTAAHPAVPHGLRGTYAGMAHPEVLEHLTALGVTAVELMPVHQFMHDGWLLDRGLRNYWGYNTIGFFAPHAQYASTSTPEDAVDEFKAMVHALHQAGLEVILDVVYNHTAEGNELGPTVSFRGIDNPSYYHLVADDLSRYENFSGTGNTLNAGQPSVLQLIMDSLRYWVLEMHVDGFRFDLAAALAREVHDVDKLSAFFDLVQQDPVISRVKLIAEPWDNGADGYQIGNFPAQWSEWNGRYRDTMRDYWRGQLSSLGEFATRFAGSSDLYGPSRRRPSASINYVTCHDGFTLNDLVSYDTKHNQDNPSNDGNDDNRSWNCGTEGPTNDPAVLALRAQQRRNFLATTVLSQGTPMLLHGDEFGRTQQGNNNAYCQDSPLVWMDWSLTAVDSDLLEFTRRVIALRGRHPVFQRRRFFRPCPTASCAEITWLTPAGVVMRENDWDADWAKALMVQLNGDAIPEPDSAGLPIRDDSFLLCFNAHWENIEFNLPATERGRSWAVALDTAHPLGRGSHTASSSAAVPARSLIVFVALQKPDTIDTRSTT
ncbi:glycogen debranching enzyme GlgX [Mycobacteroides chelonae]|uniref:Glycogen debranching enzyme GlgX n=1 Tax=Mycobacteroides chelonae TaxID=1774 RepID=A0A1S1M3G0_MYCCH|nr:glycogen debranching protein GlgX [Mycobacteroides chelonae]OHU28267.1 glycogen debranching enzyme GlgX [Mycobacteroides chelonae]OHU63686.1 glycogen debranching enzyme GlgX [Mycobacteroides chelonae]OHU76425.1 glycogen debranching enzyme GlgX [Mycobacteroides chelonae]QQG88318.1 glycogen debranching protein GlgX [Mycobacteroides chelonae]QQG93135.1 glycogen debranching protein GlgX [Mycobacteroides chelonae]